MKPRNFQDPAVRKARAQLFRALALFVLVLAVPLYLLLSQAYSQLERQSYYSLRLEAESIVKRVEQEISAIIQAEEARSPADYSFFGLASNALVLNQAVSLSPLANPSAPGSIPGLIGYFQIEPDGQFSTPILPNFAALGLSDEAFSSLHGVSISELQHRRGIAQRVKTIVGRGNLGARPDIQDKPIVAQRVDDLNLKSPRWQEDALNQRALDNKLEEAASAAVYSKKSPERIGRKEKISLPNVSQIGEYLGLPRSAGEQESQTSAMNEISAPVQQRQARSELPAGASELARDSKAKDADVISFESDIDPFRAKLQNGSELLFFRRILRGKAPYIQGFAVDGKQFIEGIVEREFRQSSLSLLADLIVAVKGLIFLSLNPTTSAREIYPSRSASNAAQQSIIFRNSLSEPLGSFELIFTADKIPLGVGAGFIHLVALSIVIVLVLGSLLVYRAGLRQIELAEKKSDFVSAISHELKTPLTTIRMYAEMLRAGWVSDQDKQRSYFDYIFSESERLSRLVSNVLEYSRLIKGNVTSNTGSYTATELLELARTKCESQVASQGFKLEIDRPETLPTTAIQADPDFFTQIMINFIDNALKFSKEAEPNKIVLGLRLHGEPPTEAVFYVRDFGPGVAEKEQKRIFELFYRAEQELTRSTTGTGIGLALVKEYAARMGARIDMRNCKPGAEFQVRFALSGASRFLSIPVYN